MAVVLAERALQEQILKFMKFVKSLANSQGFFLHAKFVELKFIRMIFFTRRYIALTLLLVLAGCSSNPMMLMLSHLRQQDVDAERLQFDPRFHYLRVEVAGSVIYMASSTPDVDSANSVSVWYSAIGEVLRFQNGRLLAAIGTSTEWRSDVIPELPPWSQLAITKEPVKWVRFRNVMPGYRLGVQDFLVLRRISPPNDSRLRKIDPEQLVWFEERIEKTSNGKGSLQGELLPPARYAVDLRNAKESVVYGEQCISTKLCFSWQRWPVLAEEKK